MSQVVLVVALLASLLAVAWLYAYKLRHPHTKDDLVKARRDSVDKSRSVVSGKVQEHLAPLFPAFLSQFNPKDARFSGRRSTSSFSTAWMKVRFGGWSSSRLKRAEPASCLASADAATRSRRDELSISCCACRQT